MKAVRGFVIMDIFQLKNNTRTALLITKHFERVSYEYISNIAVFIKDKYKITQSL